MAAVTHRVYIRSPAAKADRALLEYLHREHSTLRAMGLGFDFHEVDDSLARNPAVVAAFKQKGITALPALITPSGVYTGLTAIHGLYERNLQEFRREPVEDSDPLEAHYKSVGLRGGPPLAKRGEGGDEEDPAEGGGASVGEGSGRLMDQVQRYVARRQEKLGSRPGARSGGGSGGGGGGGGAPPRKTGGGEGRADNIAPPASSEDQEYQRMLASLAGTLDSEKQKRAFDPSARPADDTDYSALDELMEKSYYSNLQETGV
jgi:hypothetical protein